MCGIAGLFLKDRLLEPELGQHLSRMLVSLTDRGPDSAGIAVYRAPEAGLSKLTVRSETPGAVFPNLEAALREVLHADVSVRPVATHAVIELPAEKALEAREALSQVAPGLTIMSGGEAVEIYKEVGLPRDVATRFGVEGMQGTHGIGHTRMATESAVTTLGAHPFSTGPDQCLVHNGSLSNHNNLRRELKRNGVRFETENDTEVAAAYLSWQLGRGVPLGDALEQSLSDLDGFYTFVVGTRNGFGVLRDPIACKPAVLAETDQYVAFGSEYRALAALPGIESARVWEPEPATVYFWEH